MSKLELVGLTVIGCVIAVLVIWGIGLKRAALAVTGRPTSEEARIEVDAAKAAAGKETEAKVDEVLHASPEENLRRVRELTRRGLRPK